MDQPEPTGFFRGVYQIEVDFHGEPARMPVFYRDASSITAIFPASSRKLRKILPKKDYRPLLLAPGVGAIAITALTYRDTDIRPYNELSIAVLMSYQRAITLPLVGVLNALRRKEFHVHVHHLPVTTKLALDAGVEVYNYPKFLSEITYEERDGQVHVGLLEDGQSILSMKSKILNASRQQTTRFITYPVKEDRAQTANLLFSARKIGTSFSPGAVELELGKDHAIGLELKDLLITRRPVYYMYVPDFQSILYPPTLLE